LLLSCVFCCSVLTDVFNNLSPLLSCVVVYVCVYALSSSSLICSIGNSIEPISEQSSSCFSKSLLFGVTLMDVGFNDSLSLIICSRDIS
jgi:hypothetical protein